MASQGGWGGGAVGDHGERVRTTHNPLTSARRSDDGSEEGEEDGDEEMGTGSSPGPRGARVWEFGVSERSFGCGSAIQVDLSSASDDDCPAAILAELRRANDDARQSAPNCGSCCAGFSLLLGCAFVPFLSIAGVIGIIR